MAVRKDTVQLNIEFITDESRALAKANVDTKALTTELKKTVKSGGDVADVMRRIEQAGAKVEGIDLSKVAPAQLITRARQLKQVLDVLPSSSPRVAVLQKEYKRINDRLADIRQSSRGVSSAFSKGKGSIVGSLTGVLAAATAAVAAFSGLFRVISDGVQRAAEFEQLNVALSTFLGSAEKAKEVIADLQKFSIATPFEPEQVNRAGKALLAFGIEQEALIPLLTKVGDVAAGTGKDFNELVLIVGKAKAAGRVQGEELNQLAEAGIPIYDELAKVTGRQTTEIRKLGEQGKLSYEDLEAVFTNLTSEGGRFNGLLEKQSKTITGLASTAKGALGALSRNVAGAFTPLIKTVLPSVISFVNRLTERVAPLAQAFGQTLVRVFRFLGDVFRPLVQSVQRLGASLASASDGTGRFSAIMQVLGATLAFVVNSISGLITFVSRLINTFASMGGGSGGIIQRIFVQPITSAIEILGKFIAVLNGLVSASRVAFDSIGSIGDVFSGTIGLAFDKIKGLFSDNESAINARKASLAAAYGKLGTSIGDAFVKGYEDALGEGNIPNFSKGADAGAGIGGGPVTRVQDPAETAAQAKATKKAAEEAARIARLKAERAGDQATEAISTNPDIALLTDEEEIARAEALATKLGDIDEQLLQRRITLAEREKEVKEALREANIAAANETTDAVIALLGRDEDARKKNAGVIKALMVSQAIANGIAEITALRLATAKEAASVALIPGAATAVQIRGVVQQIAAAVRAAANVAKIKATKFARGGQAKFGTFGGRSHSTGGNRGVFEDGTQVEVQSNEDFFILNRAASAERAQLSALNERNGGVPFFEQGGSVFSAPSTTPTIETGLLPAAGSTDTSAMATTMSALLEAFHAFPTKLTADVVYGNITQAGADLDKASSAAEV